MMIIPVVFFLLFKDNISRVRNERSSSIENQIVDDINQNLYSPSMSLSQVADKFKKSSAYISTVFKNVTGANYSDYINQTRIIRATELLSQGNMSIEDVCHSVGYVSLSTFRRNFNKYTKTNPGEYITEKRDGNIKVKCPQKLDNISKKKLEQSRKTGHKDKVF